MLSQLPLYVTAAEDLTEAVVCCDAFPGNASVVDWNCQIAGEIAEVVICPSVSLN